MDEPNSRWRALQEQNLAWAAKNFPTSVDKPYRPLLGVVEELGELAGALLDGDGQAFVDAVADAMIYACDLCTKHAWSLPALVAEAGEVAEGEDFDPTSDGRFGLRLLREVGRLSHCRLKLEQGIRGSAEQHLEKAHDSLVRIVAMVWDVYDERRPKTHEDVPLDEAVWRVWSGVVAKRDWTKDPKAGGSN